MATRLLQLLGGHRTVEDAVIGGLTVDSRQVADGDLFVALPGTNFDGRKFIPEAIERGAAAILTTPGAFEDAQGTSKLPIVEDANPRRLYAQMAARFAGSQPKYQVAVTGTNGKTSVADFARQLWQKLGKQAASLGTLGVRSETVNLPGGLTTPDPMQLHAALATLKQADIDHVAIEASSHGLDQYRLDGMQLSAAAFTNLSRDHLDYHKNEQSYFYAKARLIGELLAPGAAAVLNVDDQWGRVLDDVAWGRSLERIGFGRGQNADLQLVSAEPTACGQKLVVGFRGQTAEVELPLIGDFQAMNALAATGLLIAVGEKPSAVIEAVSSLRGVPGRMELLGTVSDAGIFVDYAHTPDGLKTVLTAARAHKPNRLHVVFGCGGDRDAGKRPQMGAIASALADCIYITDDNPRSEQPSAIRSEILASAPSAIEIGNRGEAIAAAMDAARPGDIVIIAGKGHETGQIVGDQVLEFSDIETVRALLNEKMAGGQVPAGDRG